MREQYSSHPTVPPGTVHGDDPPGTSTSPRHREGRRGGVEGPGRRPGPEAQINHATEHAPSHAPPVTREWPEPPSPRPVPWGPLTVTAAVFFVVLLLVPDTGGVCSTIFLLVIGYAAFSIFASTLARTWRRPPRPGGRARLYRDVAARCLRAAERYPFAGDRLRREADYYRRKMRR